MLETSMVQKIDVLHDGQTCRASYFVDHSVVHAMIGERVLLAPLVGGDAAVVVRSLLKGHLLQTSRKMRHVEAWTAIV